MTQVSWAHGQVNSTCKRKIKRANSICIWKGAGKPLQVWSVCALFTCKNSDNNILVLLGVNSWVKHLGILDPMEASSAKSYVKPSGKIEDQLPDLFLFPVASWRAGEALFGTKEQEDSKAEVPSISHGSGLTSSHPGQPAWGAVTVHPKRHPLTSQVVDKTQELRSCPLSKRESNDGAWSVLLGWWTAALDWHWSNDTSRSQTKDQEKQPDSKAKNPQTVDRPFLDDGVWICRLILEYYQGLLYLFVLFTFL